MRRHGLTAVTLVQNEARWLPEWLEYHLLPAISVEHFYLYDDDATGPGSTDGLVATLAPYRRFVTLHRVSELGPMPTPGEEMSASDMRMCSETPPRFNYRRVGGKCVRNFFHFPQQAVAIRHAAAAYGHRSRAMLLIDVDEFIIHTFESHASSSVPSRAAWYARRAGASKSAASVLVSALRGRVGAVKLSSVVMLPDERFNTRSSDDGLFLTRNCTRQLVLATTRAQAISRGEVFIDKNVVVPRALGVLDGLHYYGTIHQIGLRGHAETVHGESLGLQLAHFRYRSASAWAARRNRTYLLKDHVLHGGRAAARQYDFNGEPGRPGSFATAQETAFSVKAAEMARWEAVLQQPYAHSAPQLGLLRHWAALATAMTKRWQKYSVLRVGVPPPPAVRGLIDAAAVMVSRLSVLLVAEPRSGSTLVGKLSFDARKDFLYVYEPCRMRPKTAGRKHWDGAFFETACASWVAEILRCGISLRGFRLLHRDASAFNAQSSALAAITDADRVTDGSRGTGITGAYVDWLHRCWSSHRAAKVVRISDPAALRAERRVDDARFRVVHLIRDPKQVIASRLSLHAFARRGHFNPEGGAEGVVRATCRAMTAMVEMPLLPSTLRRYGYEEVLSTPTAVLSDLYEWLGLGNGLPPSVLRMVRQCRLGNSTLPSLASSSRFRACEFDERRSQAPRRRMQLTQQQGELIARECGTLASFHQRGICAAQQGWRNRLACMKDLSG